MSDKEIVQKLKTKISQDPVLSKLQLKISCEDGTVYLEGEAEKWEQVVALGHLAAGAAGVRGVVNKVWPKSLPRPKKKRKTKEKASWDGMKVDVVIVGAGIVGATIARELSRFDLKVVVVEKEADVAWGQSKANPGWVHAFAGVDVDPKALKAKLCVRGNAMYDKLAQELDFPFKRIGLLAIVTEEELLPLLDFVKDLAKQHDIPVEIIRDREEIFRREPRITEKALAALFFPTYGSTSPYLATIALMENAGANGVKLLLDTAVTDVMVEGGKIKGVATDRGNIFTKFLVNAAGLYSDEIAEMAGAREFTIHPRKGEMPIFDSKYSSLYSHNLAPATLKTDPYTKGGGIAISVDGNSIWGPNAEEVPYKEDTGTTREAMEIIWEKFSHFVPDIPKEAMITAFAGPRAATYTEDFHIAPSRKVRRLINAAGIQSPGTASAPAIAEMVLEILRKEGLYLEEKPDFNSRRKAPPSFSSLTNKKREELIAEDPKYGHVVCRCEHVTEGEVVEAIRRGATTLDGIKFRTRAGMGRCQGGFCTPHVIKILAREFQIPIERVTKRGSGSELLLYKIKALLLRGDPVG
ncbi:MAG: FAD-dependent oxidoreductase [Candidatus Bathyarchaeia archaeon]